MIKTPRRRLVTVSFAFLLITLAGSTLWQREPSFAAPFQQPPPHPEPGEVVISQIYTGGGSAGAAFQNSYIELFNRSTSARDLSGVPIAFTTATGTFTFTVALVSSRGLTIGAGQYFLVQMGPTGPNGNPLSAPDGTVAQNIEPIAGKIAVLKFGSGFPPGGCLAGDLNTVDFVGYGAAANCFEGSGPTPNLSNTTAAFRNNNGCTDTNNNAGDFTIAAPNPRNSSSPTSECTPVVKFTSSSFNVAEGSVSASVNVTRTGDSSVPVTVDYATGDTGSSTCSSTNTHANSRCDYITTLGKLSFSAGETSKTILIPIIDDVFSEGTETFQITLSNASGIALGSPSVATIIISDSGIEGGPNPIDQSGFFVRQHYVDFLNREPDPSGFAFWKNEIDMCGADQQCIEVKRINVSAAFFLAIEYQETGFFAYRFYKCGFGNLTNPPGAPVPIRFLDFLRDMQQIGKGIVVGAPGWEAALEANKAAYATEFVQRTDFKAAFPDSMTADQFVTKLDTNAGGVLSAQEKADLVASLASAPADVAKRAAAVRGVADDVDLKNAELRKAFVLSQYFGYLRRNPFDSPDSDFSGFQFWLNKLNDFNGNFIQAEMVKAFITSTEYRNRFGP